MELSPEQQAQLDEQKKQCIFCQIIEGKIPSKKVYEDDLVVGILDINPATMGHVLFMPKEHYPIMPLIPQETFKHMFNKVREVDSSIKKALLCKETTLMIANGGAAGQQSAHFMMHIIPREGGDDLQQMDVDINGKNPDDTEVKEVKEKCGQILSAMLNKNLPALGYETGNTAQTSQQQNSAPEGVPEVTKEQLLQIINSNPQIKDMILKSPDQFKQLVPQHPQLSQLFAKFNVDEIIDEIAKSEGKE